MPAPGGIVEEPGVLQHERRLVSERLSQSNLVVAEDTPLGRAGREGADHPVLHQERHSQDRSIGDRLEALADVGGVRDAGVVEEVARGYRPTLVHDQTHDPGAAREDDAGAESHFSFAGERDGLQIPGLGKDTVERGFLDAEERAHAFDQRHGVVAQIRRDPALDLLDARGLVGLARDEHP